MIVRLARPGAPPYDNPRFVLSEAPMQIDPSRWTYVFVRGPVPTAAFGGCAPVVVAASGPWTLLQPRSCRP